MASKYERYVKPRLKEIKLWAEQGISQEEIAGKLKIACSTFREYRKKYEELEEVFILGDESAVESVENSLFKSAMGGIVKVNKAFKVKRDYYDEQGRKCSEERVVTAEEDEYVPPNPTSIIFFLKNKRPQLWNEKLTVAGNVDGGIEVIFENMPRAE